MGTYELLRDLWSPIDDQIISRQSTIDVVAYQEEVGKFVRQFILLHEQSKIMRDCRVI